MTTVRDIYDMINGFASVYESMKGDNVGLLLGGMDREVTAVLVALDVTEEVAAEAAAAGAQLIVSHHPVTWGVSRITDDSAEGRKLIALIERGLSVISMHTNLDAAEGGVNDALAAQLGLRDISSFIDSLGLNLGRVGSLEREMTVRELALHVKTALAAPGVRFVDSGKPIRRVAVIGGSGGADFTYARDAGADALVTGDGKYSKYLTAWEERFSIIDAGHFATENVICEPLAARIRKDFPGLRVEISKRHRDVVEFI